MLPDVDGFEVCRRLRSNKTTASIPVDHSLFRAMVSPEFLSVFAILKKPAIGDQLLAAITAAAQRT
jgi:DNA-binding response OmpR family regulator